MRLGLALSGGGLRATLFHLGVVKALQRHGALKDVKHITSVSGGSILAAHLVKNWNAYIDEATFAQAAKEIIDFSRMDVRGRIFRRLMLPPYYLLPYVENLSQKRLRRDGTVRNLLFERYLKKLFGDGTLSELVAANPNAPSLDILTTNLTRGSLAYFNGGTFVPNDEATDEPTLVPVRTTVARAVMTSALFPAVFPTIELNADNLLADADLFPQAEYFTDGGVYDNLGVRRFETLLRAENCSVDKILVCDASGVFERLVGSETLGYWKTALRSADILMKRLAESEYQVASTQPKRFSFIRISDNFTAGDNELPRDVQRQVKNVRTDLDRFSTTEIDTIVEHGYFVAARKLPEDCGPAAAPMPSSWRPFSDRKRPLESEAVRMLKRARVQSTNLLRWNDWASYIHPALLVIVLVLAWRWYDGGRFDRYYKTLPAAERELTESLHEPIRAEKEVKAALAHPSARAETRLHVAMIAYSLWINGRAPQKVFDDALPQLAHPERVIFEEARWRHYFSALPLKKSSFGVPDIKDAAMALRFVGLAIPYVSPDSQVETAMTCYSTFIVTNGNKLTQPLALKSLDLLKDALDKLDQPDIENRLNEQNRFRARLLEGHYLRARGTLSELPKESEALLRKADKAYADAGTVSVLGEYWKVELNRCNALDDAAGAVQKYRDKKIFATKEERQTVDNVIQTTLDQALERCHRAQELAPPEGAWGIDYTIGTILIEKIDPRAAAQSLLSGYAAAQKRGEGDEYVKYLKGEGKKIYPLCQDAEFSRTLFTVCR